MELHQLYNKEGIVSGFIGGIEDTTLLSKDGINWEEIPKSCKFIRTNASLQQLKK